MRILTPEQITNWISLHNQIEDPYLGEEQPLFRIQCYAPRNYTAIESFVEVFCDQIITSGDLLCHITDDSPTKPSRNIVLDDIRKNLYETRPLQDAPGLLAERNEMWNIIAIFSLICCFEWKGYLYGCHNQLILYNWEGEIFDIWTNSEIKHNEILDVVKSFQLETIVNVE